MTVCWKSWPNLGCICLLLYATGAVSQTTFDLEPLNSTVLRGSNVTFTAKVEGEWQIMTWKLGEFQVVTVNSSSSVSSSSQQFSASKCSSDWSCVQFTILPVNRSEAGTVTCTVQGEFGSKTAHLYVEERGTVHILGQNVTVEQDQQVEFQCVAAAWCPRANVSWVENGGEVDSSLYNTSSVSEGGCSNSTSVLRFQAVRSSTVECRATLPTFTTPESSSVFLGVVPKPSDWTVLIAVVLSIGGSALLVLLILGILFCYKRRGEKQANYQDEMSRRVRTQSQIGGVNAEQKQGKGNAGYVPEDQTSVSPSEFNDSGFFQANGSNIAEAAGPATVTDRQGRDVVTNQGGNGCVNVPGIKKHRHVTIV